MKILLTNDDGIDAPGIKALEKKLTESAHEVVVVAPDKEQSATSHSITLHQPLRIYKRAENRFAVTGSPADCVILAEKVVLQDKIDLVISGINGGQNMGEDVLYSGTVAAALEAMFLGFKAIAVSLASYVDQKFDEAASVFNYLIENGLHNLIDNKEIFNINIPNLSLSEINGIRITQIGHRKYQDFVKEQLDPRGRKIYWIGGAKPVWEKREHTDFKAIDEKFVSITPMTPSFCRAEAYPKLHHWAQKIKVDF